MSAECIEGWMELGITRSEATFRCQLGQHPSESSPVTEARMQELGRPRFNLPSMFLKDRLVDEVLPLLIVLGHRRPEVKEFYQNLIDLMTKLAKAGSTSWVGQWMAFKLNCMLLERFGLLWVGGAESYDRGLSWAFGVVAATEFLSDIQIGSITEGDTTHHYFAGLGKPIAPKKKKK